MDLVARCLLFDLPRFYASLSNQDIFLQGRTEPEVIGAALETMKSLFSAYYLVCLNHLLVCGAIIQSILRAMAKQDSTMTLSRATCPPLSWAVGILSISCGLSSIVLSFYYAGHLPLLSSSDNFLLEWIQNARSHAASPWRSVPALLAAPSVLCIWASIFFVIHWMSWGQCPSIVNGHVDDVLPKPPTIDLRTLKVIIMFAVFVLWTYTLRAMRAFADLSHRPKSSRFLL